VSHFTRIPAHVVVDARNLIGMAASLSMSKPTLTFPGFRDLLTHYGFEMVKLNVGIGLARNAGSGVLSHIHTDNSRLRTSLQRDGASILEGEIRFEEDKVKEKMVDVKCALKVVEIARMNDEERPKAIVLFSRDLDLLPAAEQATALGVPTYIMSSDAAYLRHQHHLLLTPASYSQLSDGDADLAFGNTDIAKLIGDPGPHLWTVDSSTTLLGVSGRNLTHESGIRGFASDVDIGVATAGEELTLYIADTIFDQELPVPYCTSADTFDVERPWLVETEVALRKDSSKIEIELNGQVVRVKCPVGTATPGQRILIRCKGGLYHQQAVARLIGPLDEADSSAIESAHLELGRPIVVQVETIAIGGNAFVALTPDAQRYPLKKALGVRPRLGYWYAAVPSPTAGGSFELELVSTELLQR